MARKTESGNNLPKGRAGQPGGPAGGKTRTCSLCGQSFDGDDPLWPARRARHEQRHKRTIPPTNQITGIVTWQ